MRSSRSKRRDDGDDVDGGDDDAWRRQKPEPQRRAGAARQQFSSCEEFSMNLLPLTLETLYLEYPKQLPAFGFREQ